MATNEEKNEMLVMVLADLAAICKKLSENSAVPEHLCERASEFVEGFDSLVPYRGQGTPRQHFQGEDLLEKRRDFCPTCLKCEQNPQALGTDSARATLTGPVESIPVT